MSVKINIYYIELTDDEARVLEEADININA